MSSDNSVEIALLFEKAHSVDKFSEYHCLIDRARKVIARKNRLGERVDFEFLLNPRRKYVASV